MSFPQPPQKVETLLGFLGYGAGVEGPGEVLRQFVPFSVRPLMPSISSDQVAICLLTEPLSRTLIPLPQGCATPYWPCATVLRSRPAALGLGCSLLTVSHCSRQRRDHLVHKQPGLCSCFTWVHRKWGEPRCLWMQAGNLGRLVDLIRDPWSIRVELQSADLPLRVEYQLKILHLSSISQLSQEVLQLLEGILQHQAAPVSCSSE
nr:uncharacterized protein LOC111839452 [Paramormyrops kingsleyae]